MCSSRPIAAPPRRSAPACRRAREGERTARRQGQAKRSKLDAHGDYLLGLIEAEPDITIVEMQERLRGDAGVTASVGTIWTFLDRAGLTFKNVWPAPSASGFCEVT